MDHLKVFNVRNFGGPGGSDEGLRQDGPALITEIDRMITGVQEFLASFLGQAREDLGIGDS